MTTWGHACAYCGGYYKPAETRTCPGCGAPPKFSAEDRRHLAEQGRLADPWTIRGDQFVSMTYGHKKLSPECAAVLMTEDGPIPLTASEYLDHVKAGAS